MLTSKVATINTRIHVQKRKTHLSSGLSNILIGGIREEQSIRATSSMRLSWPNRMVVKFSMSNSTPETLALAGIDAETNPPRVTSDMLFRLVVFCRHFNKTSSREGKRRGIPATVSLFCIRHCSCALLKSQLPLQGHLARSVGMPRLAIHRKAIVDLSVWLPGEEKKSRVASDAVDQDQSCGEPSAGLQSRP